MLVRLLLALAIFYVAMSGGLAVALAPMMSAPAAEAVGGLMIALLVLPAVTRMFD